MRAPPARPRDGRGGLALPARSRARRVRAAQRAHRARPASAIGRIGRARAGARRAGLPAARAGVLGVRIRPPSALGTPDGIFEDPLQGGVDVTFLYQPRTVAARLGPQQRVLVSAVRGTLERPGARQDACAGDACAAAPHRRRPGAARDGRAAHRGALPAQGTRSTPPTRGWPARRSCGSAAICWCASRATFPRPGWSPSRARSRSAEQALAGPREVRFRRCAR